MKPTRKHADKIFNKLQTIEDNYWKNILDLERRLLKRFGSEYEFAVVDGIVVGIGKANTNGTRKLMFHRA